MTVSATVWARLSLIRASIVGGSFGHWRIAMVVIGGTSLMGGRGSVILTLVGALTIGYLQKILSINQFSTDSRLMLTGVIIVCAVLIQRGRS